MTASMSGLDFGAALDCYLSDKSYVEDFGPTSADVELLDKLAGLSLDDGSHPHVKRWKSHVLSFTQEERNRFPRSNKPSNDYIQLITSAGGVSAVTAVTAITNVPVKKEPKAKEVIV